MRRPIRQNRVQPGQPEPVSCGLAGGIAGFAGAAHVRSLVIDNAPRFDTDLSNQSGTSVPMAPHAIHSVVDKVTRDAAQTVLILQREPRPVARVRATGAARITSPDPERRVGSLWHHIVYREPQFVGAVTLDRGSGLRRQDWPSPSLPIGWNKARSTLPPAASNRLSC
jgi:hypothetical protein